MDLRIRPFVDEDIGFACSETSREGWDNTASTFRVCLSHDPEGCFVAEVDGQCAGMITATQYVHSAWIGNVVVSPSYRRQGIGERLMEHTIGFIEAHGFGLIWLEADPMGVGIYRRLGFEDQFESPRLEKKPPHIVSRSRAAHLSASEIDKVMALDGHYFGEDRGRLLRELIGIARGAYCVRDNGRIVGFALALPSADGVRLGPCVADDSSVAERLIDSILADFRDEFVIVAVPGDNGEAKKLLESRGFVHRLPGLRMLRGKSICIDNARGIVSLASGAWG